jgi:hypothetical protein
MNYDGFIAEQPSNRFKVYIFTQVHGYRASTQVVNFQISSTVLQGITLSKNEIGKISEIDQSAYG